MGLATGSDNRATADLYARSRVVVVALHTKDQSLIARFERFVAVNPGYQLRLLTETAETTSSSISREVGLVVIDSASVSAGTDESPATEQLAIKATSLSRVECLIDENGADIGLMRRLTAASVRINSRPTNDSQWEGYLARCLRTAGEQGPRQEPFILKGRSVQFSTTLPDFAQTLEEVRLMAGHDVTVLLLGETGSGKTTMARLIHELSPRANDPFLPLACGALQPTLIESELFGHVKGAFTGADRAKVGKFEAVGNGTLLLDEIDALSLDLQVKLLRVMETGEFEAVGSNETQKSPARLIVASNLCLETLIANQQFRSDLYYRLNVLKVALPPLRKRPEDIVAIALETIERTCATHRVREPRVHADFLAALIAYSWPGNLRELKNCIERAVLLCQDGVLVPRLLPPGVQQQAGPTLRAIAPPVASTLEVQVAVSEQAVIEEALRRCGNRRSSAARELGISRVTLYNKMKKYNLLSPRPAAERKRSVPSIALEPAARSA